MELGYVRSLYVIFLIWHVLVLKPRVVVSWSMIDLTDLAYDSSLDEFDSDGTDAPHCGTRVKRYALTGSNRWTKGLLSYRIDPEKYTSHFSPEETDAIIRQAFDVWEDAANITFVEEKDLTKEPDINILFVSRRHGDRYPFDGSGRHVAHTFPPPDGDIHFDDDEDWTNQSFAGVSLLQAAVHEIGHSLGLGHSKDKESVMYPTYNGYLPEFVLGDDDIRGIQGLFGTKSGFPSICSDPRINAIVTTFYGETVVFKGSEYYILQRDGTLANGYPRPLSQDFPDLPRDINAAFTHEGATYILKKKDYWKMEGNRVTHVGRVKKKFPGIPDNINSAFSDSSGKIYFLNEKYYYEFDKHVRNKKKITNWSGVPNGIDAAVASTDGFVYLFKGDKYYLFNESQQGVVESYPRAILDDWFGCSPEDPEEDNGSSKSSSLHLQ